MAIPHIHLPKGTIIEIVQTGHILPWAVGLHVELPYDLNYPLEKKITNGFIKNTEHNAPFNTIKHTITTADILIYHPNGQDNTFYVSLLKEE